MAENIGPGDEVITTPYTFFATAGCVARVGARPVFVDVEPDTLNIDARRIEAAVTARTKAIIPVHLYGQMADMEAIMQIARSRNLVVIEDAAQAIGAKHKGRPAASIGHYGCFSFFPSKNLGGAGDGGMVITQDAARADHLRWLRNHGMNPKYYHKLIGGNFRFDTLQAAVVEVKLRHLEGWHAARRRNARLYREAFAASGLAPAALALPGEPCQKTGAEYEACRCHIYNQFVVRTPSRDALRAHLATSGIGTEVYYPVPLHLQECFAFLGHRAGDFPESERAARETLALPIYPELAAEQIRYVAAETTRFLVQGKA
jgi:dTDP-4-amino-4,6-dideoxygalactose transaminase